MSGGVYFDRASAEKIKRFVERSERVAKNGNQHWRQQKIGSTGGGLVAWGLSAPVLLPGDILSLRITKQPDGQNYLLGPFEEVTITGVPVPNTWYPLRHHPISNNLIPFFEGHQRGEGPFNHFGNEWMMGVFGMVTELSANQALATVHIENGIANGENAYAFADPIELIPPAVNRLAYAVRLANEREGGNFYTIISQPCAEDE